ncbi:hypothetical protein A4X13_0g2578 [Tilletia indica]|uniref:Uncharacterized protein n=1 Tax=Tilletia indica TaxID=43049 RepID=A0A177THB0_9BASI|nr:hypothetical protein A4X13_0g2578 [Tilletia indica]
MTTTSVGKPRLRAFAACIECNKAKVKCDGDKPNNTPCTRCTAHNLQCGWAKSRRGRLPGSKNKPKSSHQQQYQQRQQQSSTSSNTSTPPQLLPPQSASTSSNHPIGIASGSSNNNNINHHHPAPPHPTAAPLTASAAYYPLRPHTNPAPSYPGPRHSNQSPNTAEFARFSSFGHDIGSSFNQAFHFDLYNHLVNGPSPHGAPGPSASSSSAGAQQQQQHQHHQPPINNHMPMQNYAYQNQLHHQMQPPSTSAQPQHHPHASGVQQQFAHGAAYPQQYSSSQHFVLAPPAPVHHQQQQQLPWQPPAFAPPPTASTSSSAGPSSSTVNAHHAHAHAPLPSNSPQPSTLGPGPGPGPVRNPVILPPPPTQSNQVRPGSAGGRSSNAAPSPIPRVGSTTPAPDRLRRSGVPVPSSSSAVGSSSSLLNRPPLELYSPSDPANPLNLLSHAALTSKHDGAGARPGGNGTPVLSAGASRLGIRSAGSPRDLSSSSANATPHSSAFYPHPRSSSSTNASASASSSRLWTPGQGSSTGAGTGTGTGTGTGVVGAKTIDGPPKIHSPASTSAVLAPIRDPLLIWSGSGTTSQQPHRGGQHGAPLSLAGADGVDRLRHVERSRPNEEEGRTEHAGERRVNASEIGPDGREPDKNESREHAPPPRSSAGQHASESHSHSQRRSQQDQTGSHNAPVVLVLTEQERLRKQQERRKRTQARTLGMLDANAFDDDAGPNGNGVDGAGRSAGEPGARAGEKGKGSRAKGTRYHQRTADEVDPQRPRKRRRRDSSGVTSSASPHHVFSTLSPSTSSSSSSGRSSRSASRSDVDDAETGGSEAEYDASDAFALPATKLPRSSSTSPGPGETRGRLGTAASSALMDRGASGSKRSGTGVRESGAGATAAAGTGELGGTGDSSRANKTKQGRKPVSGAPVPITEEEEARVLAAYRARLAQHGWTEARVRDAMEERANYFKDGPISSGSDVQDVPHVIALGILTEGEVDDLFAFYFRELNTICAFLDPNLHTPTYVRVRSSFLYTVICFAAASVDPRPASQAKVDKLDKLAREQAMMLAEENARSCEIVQAMLLYNLWALETGTCARDRGSTFVVHAVRMALEIGLDATAKDPTSPEQNTREGRNKMRTFITAVIQDRSLSAFTGRQPVAKLDEYGSLAEWVDSEIAIPADVEDVGFVRLRLLEQDIRARLAETDPGDHTALERIREAANARMEEWMEQWTTKPILDEAPITRGTMKVVALHVQLVLNTVTKSACRDRKADCLRIASELLMIVNTELHDSVQYICRTIQGMIAWAAVVVIQLADGDIPSLAIDTALLMAGDANDPHRYRTFARFYGRFLLATVQSVHSEYRLASVGYSSRVPEPGAYLDAGVVNVQPRAVDASIEVPNGGGSGGNGIDGSGVAASMEWPNELEAVLSTFCMTYDFL